MSKYTFSLDLDFDNNVEILENIPENRNTDCMHHYVFEDKDEYNYGQADIFVDYYADGRAIVRDLTLAFTEENGIHYGIDQINATLAVFKFAWTELQKKGWVVEMFNPNDIK